MSTMMTLTDAAVKHIKTMMIQQDGIGFRLSIKQTGCSGYSYVPKIIKTPVEKDIQWIAQDGLVVYLDPLAECFVTGLVIDYAAEEINGLKQQRLIFKNPNEKNRCGCGESFTVD